MGDCVNRFRRNTLHLRELKTGQAIRALIEEKVPHTYCWSESFIKKPADWPAHISISGFFFMNGNPQQLPSDYPLVKFLNSVGQPIIYIGFGSITLDDPGRLLKVVLRALHDTQYRAILHGLVDNNDKSLSETVFRLKRGESVDHRWLFEHGKHFSGFLRNPFPRGLD
jgi:UDP:flavonoid glycosyltransferase YjiC (YdhE family)